MIQLSFTEFGPYFWLAGLLCKLLGTLDVVKFVQKYLNSLDMLTEFLVNAQSFIIEAVFVFLGDSSKLDTIVIVKSVDVVHHF